MEDRKSFSLFKICIGLLIAIALVFVVYLRFELNELKAQRDAMVISTNQLKSDVASLEDRLAAEFNENYIEDFAKDKLNLRHPDEVIFYNDLTD